MSVMPLPPVALLSLMWSMPFPGRARHPDAGCIRHHTIISALLFRGAASWLVEHWQSGEVTLMVSRETARELLRVLAYPKFGLSPAQVEAVATRYLRHAERVVCAGEDAGLPLCRDPNDQMFIRLAATGRADLLVSGDKDLLSLCGTIPFVIESLIEYRHRFVDK